MLLLSGCATIQIKYTDICEYKGHQTPYYEYIRCGNKLYTCLHWPPDETFPEPRNDTCKESNDCVSVQGERFLCRKPDYITWNKFNKKKFNGRVEEGLIIGGINQEIWGRDEKDTAQEAKG